MTDIIAESDRLEKRVRSMLDLARPLEVKVRPDDLAAFLHRLVDELRARAPGSIAVELAIDDVATAALARVLFDPRALGECFETVAVNALEALEGHEGKGHLRFRASRDHFADGR